MAPGTGVLLAVCVLCALLLVAGAGALFPGLLPCRAESFYTPWAVEEPTRSYLAYTGSVPDPDRWRGELHAGRIVEICPCVTKSWA